MMNFIKVAVLACLAGLSGVAADCGTGSDYACAYHKGVYIYVALAPNDHGCTSRVNMLPTCCPANKLDPTAEYKLGDAQALGCVIQ
ncbi:hypothetical protein MJO29_013151 [Puccinia striiformis f. sp. tritici]|uniref:hypothetical protein n=1 Tax=Puccinia striiformis f. sp. tritici TaxID=168172 RepID=UPI0020080586|nr:hypothetical protein Pst134EA_024591 [Puccinia striiformis f. sp. tritici]KAH9453730.1 hypothetical protein Pst134EA_024591 [Puccinia striiformis f. sp. tritici]KAI7943307.1 hypothetical protein MJO29_013151 [Puccinia striiformis f. sp. tritici]